MASNPPSRCCAVGYKETGKAAGYYTTLNGVDAYVIKASQDNGKGVILLTDILGHKFPNGQLIADSFAENGYTTVIPDLFHGDPVSQNPPPNFDFMAWLTKGTDNKGGHQVENIDPVVESTIKAMRSELGITSVAAAGYCLGAKYVVRFLRPGLIDVGFGAHPSFVDVEELNAMTGPLSIAAAEHDEIFPAEKRRLTEDTLLAHKEKLPYQISLFSGTSHGFAVRGDTTIKQVAFAKRSAFVQAVQWFEEYL